jgi:LysR family cys regulon transcriptional activator
MLLSEEADVGIATEALDQYPDLLALPSYRWTHCIIVPPNHPLLEVPLSVQALVEYPLITYEAGFTGRSHIDEAFSREGLVPNIVLSAMDADVIKTYVELGLGVGIVASIAYEEERDTRLRAIDAGVLFGVNLTKLAVRRGSFLRGYVLDFIESFAPSLNRQVVQQALSDDRAPE